MNTSASRHPVPGRTRRAVPLARSAILVASLAASVWLTACVPLAVTGVAVGAMAAADRRTLGAQTDDQAIELKALGQVRDSVANAGGVSITSYNRKVLLTGQVADEDTKAKVERIVAALPNVRGVQNELQISGRVGLGTSTNDAALTARVKTALIEDRGIDAQAVKVVTEAGVVYLMGMVRRTEGDQAARVASRVSGVTRVVTVFEYIGG
ncbi:MAG TPA: BON domain-containing protein [Burkholderiaceae bacterium]|nr:BON domain-containing protein [Burkholderiaceae bacterium]